MERACPSCGVKRGKFAFVRLIDGHRVPTRECVHCIAAAARAQHKERKRRYARGR
jgi:Zn ribbon nucleic-acid-binding protein